MVREFDGGRLAGPLLVRVRLLLGHYLHHHCGIWIDPATRSSSRMTNLGREYQLRELAYHAHSAILSGGGVSHAEVLCLLECMTRCLGENRFVDDPFLDQEVSDLSDLLSPAGQVAAPEEPASEEVRLEPDPGPGPDHRPDEDPVQHDRSRQEELGRALARLESKFSYGAVGEVSESDAAWGRPRPVTALGQPAMRRLLSGRLLHATAVPVAALRRPAGHDAQLVVAALLRSMPVLLVSERDRRASGGPLVEVLSIGDFETDKPVSMLSWLYRAVELGADQVLVVDCAGQDEAGRTSILRDLVGDSDEVRLL